MTRANRIERRAILLVMTIGVAFFAVACGRATEADINRALGITPTPTQSPEEIAQATSAAQVAATQTAEAAVVTTPGAVAAVSGDVSRGSMVYGNYCLNCHRPGGNGPDLLEPGGVGAGMTTETLLPILREGLLGEGLEHPPGPYQEFTLTERNIIDLAAYIEAEAGP